MSQVNKLRRIVIASVLKPVDESRMYEKIGVSLAETGQYEVHCIGYPTQSESKPLQNIYFHPIADKPFGRISLKRVFAPWQILKIVHSLRPGILIITTHELLAMAVLARLILSCKLLYDIQENYCRNVLHTSSLPVIVRHVLAYWIRFKEIISSNFINHFILAEAGYLSELKFAKPNILLQNKLPKEIAGMYRKKEFNGYSTLVFSGTLAETTGVFKVIEIVTELNHIDPSFRLIIIGSSPVPSVIKKLLSLSMKHSFIEFKGQNDPVPHKDILSTIQQADFGIIYYPPNPATAGSMPTKLYEYMALHLPLLIRHTEKSHALVTEHHAGITLPEPIDYPALIDQMKSFRPGQSDSGLYWDDEVRAWAAKLSK